MKKNYTIASEEGANHFGHEVGVVAELEMDMHTEKAVVAAGWVSPVDEKSDKKGGK